MIDTRQKRASVLEVPGIQYSPVADLVIDSIDRMLIAGLYGGITPLFNDFFFWRKTADGELQWRSTQGASHSFASQRQTESNPWVKQNEIRDEA